MEPYCFSSALAKKNKETRTRSINTHELDQSPRRGDSAVAFSRMSSRPAARSRYSENQSYNLGDDERERGYRKKKHHAMCTAMYCSKVLFRKRRLTKHDKKTSHPTQKSQSALSQSGLFGLFSVASEGCIRPYSRTSMDIEQCRVLGAGGFLLAQPQASILESSGPRQSKNSPTRGKVVISYTWQRVHPSSGRRPRNMAEQVFRAEHWSSGHQVRDSSGIGRWAPKVTPPGTEGQ